MGFPLSGKGFDDSVFKELNREMQKGQTRMDEERSMERQQPISRSMKLKNSKTSS